MPLRAGGGYASTAPGVSAVSCLALGHQTWLEEGHLPWPAPGLGEWHSSLCPGQDGWLFLTITVKSFLCSPTPGLLPNTWPLSLYQGLSPSHHHSDKEAALREAQ